MAIIEDYDKNLEETLLAEYLLKQVCDNASGRSDDECLHNLPHDVYFIGNLRPYSSLTNTNQPAHWSELENKLAPYAFGADFLVEPKENSFKIPIKVEWNCYYRVLPTLAQQRALQDSQNNDGTEEAGSNESTTDNGVSESGKATETNLQISEDDWLINQQEKEIEQALVESPETDETISDRRQTRTTSDSLFIRFRKIPCFAEIVLEFHRNSDGNWSSEYAKRELEVTLEMETKRAMHQVVVDPECLKTNSPSWEKVRVLGTVLDSEKAFFDFFQNGTKPILPVWRWDVRMQITSYDKHNLLLQFRFGNASPLQNPPDKADSSKALNPNIEPFFFDTRAEFEFINSEVKPFELEIAPRGFRYDRNLYGQGFNCAVDYDNQKKIFWTTHTPTHKQMRYSTQEKPEARFADLADNPVPILRRILNAMEDYLSVWDTERLRYIEQQPDWENIYGNEFDKDKNKFIREIEDFRCGVKMIESDADVCLAFKLTNETFKRVGENPQQPKERHKTSWRLFQIVFIVSQIPSISALKTSNPISIKEREKVDIVYFPTGGGKTEAYLGTLAFHCFYDRLRGKTAGTTAWTRFPLRLLTLQQTQRVADVIGMAELVRCEQTDSRLSSKDIAAFAVGYFVGKEATPNEIHDVSKNQYATYEDQQVWSQAHDEKARQNWRRLITCPSCRTKSVVITFDEKRIRIFHQCTNADCRFHNGKIPVYVIDNEIYRYLPSVLVGTIDKLASVGNQRKMAQMFGQVDGKCENHGYYKGKCCQKDCDNKNLKPGIPRGLSGPTLFIQDELHLLSEGLGTFDSHYETFTQNLQHYFGQQQPLKIIASSATIEAFERQVDHLYKRSARVFPGYGPTLDSSFYAETKSFPQRIFVGILPHNKTIFNSILELIEIYHRAIQKLQNLKEDDVNAYGGSLIPGSADWKNLLDTYQTSLTYFLANRELDSISTDLHSHTNPRLEADKFRPLETVQMTGNISTDEVTQTLEKVERPAEETENPTTVLATNMISHGVDVDRFNSMIFYGMPRQTAEYIQASSRVGRSHVGIVFDCLHPTRERDRSHYTYFSKYHEFLGRLVEPVAINRWAKFSINRTLPGLFMGVLLQVLSNRPSVGNKGGRYYSREYVAQLFSSNELTEDDFIDFLIQAYKVSSPVDVAANDFRQRIEIMVADFKRQIRNASTKWVSESLIPPPMRSLRDVEETLTIELEY